MLIPPSNTFMVYSLVSGTSIAVLFMAGIGPGLVWTLACMLVVALYVRRRTEMARGQKVRPREALVVLWKAVPSLLMILIVIGGILAGIFTATESAAIAVVYCLVVGTFMDRTPAILIFAPIFLPIVVEFGTDPIHFGTMLVYNLCVGVITPPVGNVLLVGARVAGLRIEPVAGKLVPFLVALMVGLLLVVFVPALSMWLPTVLGLTETTP